MSKDQLQLLLEHLRTEEGAAIPTSSLGWPRRTAVAGARVGLGALAGKLRGRDLNLGALSPEALARLVESFGELKGVAMKMGQILSYVDDSLAPESRQLLAVLQRHSQPTPFAQIEQTIREDLVLERRPCSPASIVSLSPQLR
jgi:predicted unusual protein kinase regulating ubiquinone biosynthesis (AarF/ABC1/UbiB family)